MQRNTPSPAAAHGAMSAVALIYGINYFSMKGIYAGKLIDPMAVLSLRNLISTVFFFGYHRLFIREPIHDKKDLLLIALCAVFGIVVNQTGFIVGYTLTTPVNASVLMVTTPVFVFLTAWVLGEEHFSLRKVAGLALAFLGSFFLIAYQTGGGFSLSSDTLAGDALIMMNAASYGIYLVIVRPLIVKYHVLTLQAWLFLFGALINVPVGMFWLKDVSFSALPTGVWGGLFFLIFFSTILAYFLNAWAMRSVNSTAVAMYVFFQPVFVTALSPLLASGTVNLTKVIFIILVLVGVYLVVTKAKKGAGETA